jgi:NAD+ kinase
VLHITISRMGRCLSVRGIAKVDAFNVGNPLVCQRNETGMKFKSIAFLASDSAEAREALSRLVALYGNAAPENADCVVALGGDGHMLQTLHRFVSTGIPIYGMNRGTVGFLMNDYTEGGLMERLHAAELTTIHPLRMTARDNTGKVHRAIAFNEVSLLRQRYQAARLQISVDGQPRLEELICDGILVSTPAGSTAYNLSAHGPILPINSSLLALTPISAFRPRGWRGAILPHEAKVTITVLEAEKRPVAAVADHVEVRHVLEVQIAEDRKESATILFDPGHSLAERVLREQFRF